MMLKFNIKLLFFVLGLSVLCFNSFSATPELLDSDKLTLNTTLENITMYNLLDELLTNMSNENYTKTYEFTLPYWGIQVYFATKEYMRDTLGISEGAIENSRGLNFGSAVIILNMELINESLEGIDNLSNRISIVNNIYTHELAHSIYHLYILGKLDYPNDIIDMEEFARNDAVTNLRNNLNLSITINDVRIVPFVTYMTLENQIQFWELMPEYKIISLTPYDFDVNTVRFNDILFTEGSPYYNSKTAWDDEIFVRIMAVCFKELNVSERTDSEFLYIRNVTYCNQFNLSYFYPYMNTMYAYSILGFNGYGAEYKISALNPQYTLAPLIYQNTDIQNTILSGIITIIPNIAQIPIVIIIIGFIVGVIYFILRGVQVYSRFKK